MADKKKFSNFNSTQRSRRICNGQRELARKQKLPTVLFLACLTQTHTLPHPSAQNSQELQSGERGREKESRGTGGDILRTGEQGWKWSETVEKLLNYFLLLYLKYENESENSKTGHENERELTNYWEFRKRTNSSGFMSNTIDIRKLNTEYQPIGPSAWLSTYMIKFKCI